MERVGRGQPRLGDGSSWDKGSEKGASAVGAPTLGMQNSPLPVGFL